MKGKSKYIAVLLCVLGLIFGVNYLYQGDYIKAILFVIVGCGWFCMEVLRNYKRSRK